MVATGNPIAWKHDTLYNKLAISREALQQFNDYSTVAFVVIKDHRILHEQYWDDYSDTSHSNSFSSAKSIVSLLIGSALDEGKIQSLDDPITIYLPDFKNTNGYTLTIKHLLTMSSGIDWNEKYSNLFSPTTMAYYGDDLHRQSLSLEVISAPGIEFNYQSCDTELLGMIINATTGKTLAAYASEKLWKPIGAENTAKWSIDRPGGIEKAYCCFNSSAPDFARIGQLVLDSGMVGDKQVVSKEYIRQATISAINLTDNEGNACDYYGYHFWILTHKGHKVIYARGILGQYIFIIPSLNAVVVRLGEKRSHEYRQHAPTDVFIYLDEAFRMIGASNTAN